MQAGDLVDDEGDEGGYAERPGKAGNNIGELNVELLPVVLDPADRWESGVDTVKRVDVGRAEYGVRKESENTSHAVLGEDIHRVVNTDPVFYCCMLAFRMANIDEMHNILLVEKLHTTPVTIPSTTLPHGVM